VDVTEYNLFPTRLLTIQFSDVDDLNEDLVRLFRSHAGLRDDFDMHPDSLNLLRLAEQHPSIAWLRALFLDGLARWLQAERVHGNLAVDVVLFSNQAARGEYTLVHNHNADVVGIYYVRTAGYDRPPVVIPDPEGEYDYFAAEDGVLVLHDPRFNANLAAVRGNDYARVYPRPGLMLLFPGYLWHSVTPHLGDFPRLALSANFTLRWQTASRAETCPVRVGSASGR
jgi:hypothetical protein